MVSIREKRREREKEFVINVNIPIILL